MSSPQMELKPAFKKIENKKRHLIELIRSVPEEKYAFQPSSKSWSVGQTANHLFLSEKLSLAYLRKKMSYPDTIPKFHIKSWWSMFVYKYVLRFVKVKAPKQINMWEEQVVLLPDELDRQWSALRLELWTFLVEKYPQFKNHLVYNHPFAGRLTMKQMLTFFNDHIEHHTHQVKRIINKLGEGEG